MLPHRCAGHTVEVGLLRRVIDGVVHVVLGGVEYHRKVKASEVDATYHHVHGHPPPEEDVLLRRRKLLDKHAPPQDAPRPSQPE